MIAVDTNVLLRRVLNDDEEQSAKAKKLFEGARPVLITDVVLVETIWTLTGKRYRATKEDIRALVMSILEEPNTVFENKQAIWSALNDFAVAKPVKTANGMKAADLADALIVNKAKMTSRDMHIEYEGTYTFDRAALQIDGRYFVSDHRSMWTQRPAGTRRQGGDRTRKGGYKFCSTLW